MMERSSPRVLVVEDEPALRGLQVELLALEGFEVRAAAHGREALAILASWRAEVILLDLCMPCMDGEALRVAQRALDGFADIPTVLMSAKLGLAGEAERLQADAFIRKPFEIEALLETLRRVVSEAK